MNRVIKVIFCLIIGVLSGMWYSEVVAAINSCECHHADAEQFVQTYYEDLQSKYPERVGVVLEYWYPHRLPDHEQFIDQIKQIQSIVAETQLTGCWKNRSSIIKINATVQLKNQLEPYDISGSLYLKCADEGWKIFSAHQNP